MNLSEQLKEAKKEIRRLRKALRLILCKCESDAYVPGGIIRIKDVAKEALKRRQGK